jgi:hypothetical protein
VLNVGQQRLGSQHAPEQVTPQMAAEDFAHVLERVPGAMITGQAMNAAVALEFLGRG